MSQHNNPQTIATKLLLQKQIQKKPSYQKQAPHHQHHSHEPHQNNINSNTHQGYYQNQQFQEQSGEQQGIINEGQSRAVPIWQKKQMKKKFKKQIFGEHYNYNYRKPNQHKMYRIQENRNTQIQRANRILLEKIQSIFKRSMGRKKMKEIQITQVNSQANSEVTVSNKTANLTQKSMEKEVYVIQSANQLTNPMKKIHPQTTTNGNSKNKGNMRSMVEKIGKLGSLNSNIQLAKQQLQRQERNSSVKKTRQNSFNKNLVKLQQIDQKNGVMHKRKRFQTQMNYIQPKTTSNAHPSTLEHQNSDYQLKKKRSLQKNILPNLQNSDTKKNRKTITSNSEHPPNSPKKPQNLPVNINGHSHSINPAKKSPKIILFKTKNHLIQHKSYKIQGYVQNLTYIISAVSIKQINGQQEQFHEIITMPYAHYQELYRSKLQQNHENILNLLVLEQKNGLLQIRGFQSKYMDIYEHGELVVSTGDKQGQNTQKQTLYQFKKGKLDQLSNIGSNRDNSNNIVVYYNNADDSLDRITFVNSQHNSNTYGYGVYHRKKENKGNGNKLNKSNIRDTPVSINEGVEDTIRRGAGERSQTVPLVQKESGDTTRLKPGNQSSRSKLGVHSGTNNKSKDQSKQKDPKTAKPAKKQICTMTQNMLMNKSQVQDQYEKQKQLNIKNNSKLQGENGTNTNMLANNSNLSGNSNNISNSRIRKSPKLESNLISLQIQAKLQTNTSNNNNGNKNTNANANANIKSGRSSKNSNKNQKNDSSFLSDLSAPMNKNPNPKQNKPTLKQQQEQLLINPINPVTIKPKYSANSTNNKNGKKSFKEQYQDIEEIIED